jgi:DNA-binding response OmpR family regulator
MQILVVEDSKMAQRTVGETLEGAGYRCDYAENGLETLKLSLRENYDLIITDINVPALDGLKYVQRLRLSEKTREIPVLMLAAMRDLGSVSKAMELGVSGYVVKPIDPANLIERVRSALS